MRRALSAETRGYQCPNSSVQTFEACLARELREELGIEVAVGELVESLTHAYPEKTVCLRFYRCRWLKHEPKPLGCQECKWVSPQALADHAFPAADARLLQKLGRELPRANS